jgi:hypothetical protein
MKTNRNKNLKNNRKNAAAQGPDEWFRCLSAQEQDFAFELWKMISQEKERRAVGLDTYGDGLWARLLIFLRGRQAKRGAGRLVSPAWCWN